jgi:hypothetical protein
LKEDFFKDNNTKFTSSHQLSPALTSSHQLSPALRDSHQLYATLTSSHQLSAMVFNSGEWHAVDAQNCEGLGCPARVWCPQDHLEEAMGVLLEEMYSDPTKFGLVHGRGRGNHIWLPEEREILDVLQEHYKSHYGEEWSLDSDICHRELWDYQEMGDDMDLFWKEGCERENLLYLQAMSPLPSGDYIVPDQNFPWGEAIKEIKGLKEYSEIGYNLPKWEDLVMKRTEDRCENGESWWSGVIYYGGQRAQQLPPGVITQTLDDQDRVNTITTIKKKGHKFYLAESSYGDVYIDLKFTAYVPAVGEKAFMIIKKKALGKNAPFVCKRVF